MPLNKTKGNMYEWHKSLTELVKEKGGDDV